MNEFLKKDKAYIWHPFTQMKGWLESDQTVITEAKGIKLIDTEGKESVSYTHLTLPTKRIV